jgi:hypothetical protein
MSSGNAQELSYTAQDSAIGWQAFGGFASHA